MGSPEEPLKPRTTGPTAPRSGPNGPRSGPRPRRPWPAPPAAMESRSVPDLSTTTSLLRRPCAHHHATESSGPLRGEAAAAPPVRPTVAREAPGTAADTSSPRHREVATPPPKPLHRHALRLARRPGRHLGPRQDPARGRGKGLAAARARPSTGDAVRRRRGGGGERGDLCWWRLGFPSRRPRERRGGKEGREKNPNISPRGLFQKVLSPIPRKRRWQFNHVFS